MDILRSQPADRARPPASPGYQHPPVFTPWWQALTPWQKFGRVLLSLLGVWILVMIGLAARTESQQPCFDAYTRHYVAAGSDALSEAEFEALNPAIC